MAKKIDPNTVIEEWVERDLTAAHEAGELSPAYELEESVGFLEEVIVAGRHPILTGPPGVGKTTLIHELIRRGSTGDGPVALGGRVLQISIRRRAASLRDPRQLGREMAELVDALTRSDHAIIPFFRDIHLVHSYDLEPHLQSLVYRHQYPILGEGSRNAIDNLFEYTPELSQSFIAVHVDEPKLERAARVLALWSEAHRADEGKAFSDDALDEALHLSHRFIARQSLPRKALDLLIQTASTAKRDLITGRDVIERFSTNHRVPAFLVDPEVSLDMVALRQQFLSRILGQPTAVDAVIQMIATIKASLADPRRPLGAFLFVGPTGVGKTHLTQLLAEYLFGSGERMIRLNMADFPDDGDAMVLFGNPNHPTLQYARGLLTLRIGAHPFAVLLLDEFEKAHPSLHDRFLQLIDEGSFINGAGETVACRSMIIIATSNAGAEVYRGRSLGFAVPGDLEQMDRELDRRLEQHFRFEFLNRFDRIVHFHPIGREHIRTIALRELEELERRPGLARQGLHLEADEAVLDWLTVHGYDPSHGARYLRRTIERNVTTVLADAIVRHRPPSGSSIQLSVRGDRITARPSTIDRSAKTSREELKLPVGSTSALKTLDGKQIVAEAEKLLDGTGKQLQSSLAAKIEQRSALITTMNEPGFWDSGTNRDVLDHYRTLEVAVRVEERLARPLARLAELRQEGFRVTVPTDLERLSRAVEEAAWSLANWSEREAERGATAAWLVLGSLDPLQRAESWLHDLAQMELAWCRRLHLAADIVAYSVDEDQPSSIVIDVEGPGAGALLQMEAGIHRLYRSDAHDRRVRVQVVGKRPRPATEWPKLADARRRTGAFNLELSCRARLERPDSGLVLEFFAADRETLSHFLHDLQASWDASPDDPEVVRWYGEDGGGARDPRTGARAPRMKDVMKGDLDRFLQAWRERSTPSGIS